MGEPRTLDARGWKCPLPVVRASRLLAGMEAGERLVVTATDPSTVPDMRAWAKLDRTVALEEQEMRTDERGQALYVHTLRRR